MEEIPLRDYVETRLDLKERIDSEREKRYEEMIKAMKEATAASFAASQKAIDLASAANEKRQDSSNEIRAAMIDQQKVLMPRAECEVGLARNAADIKALTDRFNLSAGRGLGIKDSWGWLVGLIGMALALYEALKR